MSVPRLAIGPANYAGQAHAWAQAVNRRLNAEAWSFTGRPLKGGGFDFDTDKAIHGLSMRMPVFRGARVRWLLRQTTHVALDGFRTFYRARQRGRFAGDARWLADRGYKVALIAHGTDVRSPEQHMARLEWSYFREAPDGWRRALEASSRENRDTARSAGLPLFFSTPDLALDLPGGTWLPVCVDIERWRTTAPLLERRVPRVLHVPSKSVVKGTQHISRVLGELADEGVVDYVTPGRVPHAAMRDLVRGADIVVDQVLSGFYGVAAVEAMAAGRVVVGSLAPDVAALMPDVPGIISADPSTLRSAILSILDQREEMQETAQRNIGFVARWHDGRESADRLAEYLGASREVQS